MRRSRPQRTHRGSAAGRSPPVVRCCRALSDVIPSAKSILVGTFRYGLVRPDTAPAVLITRRSEVAQRASDCRGVRIGLACRRFVPQLLWDCPEPQGASKHGRSSSSWAFAGCPGPHGIFRNPGMAHAMGACSTRVPAGAGELRPAHPGRGDQRVVPRRVNRVGRASPRLGLPGAVARELPGPVPPVRAGAGRADSGWTVVSGAEAGRS